MLVCINPDLITLNGETENRKNGGSPYYKICCDTSRLITAKDPNKVNSPRPILRMACNATIESSNYELNIPPQEEDGSFTRVNTHTVYGVPTSFSSRENGKSVSVLVREETENRTDVYVVAFPFHGVLKPIQKSNRYDVLKGMISVSGGYSIPFGTYTYKNILYLVLAVDPATTTEPIGIRLESYCLKTMKKGAQITMHEMMDITLNGDLSTFNLHDEQVEPIDMEQFKGIPVWVAQVPAPQPERPRRPQNRSNERPFPTKDRTFSGQKKDATKSQARRTSVQSETATNRPVKPDAATSTKLDGMIDRAFRDDKYPKGRGNGKPTKHRR